MEDCIFCKIANGEMGTLIYENEYVAAFDDINPQAPVHTLVVPKKHIESIEDLHFGGENHECNHDEPCDGKYIKELFKAIKEVAKIKGISESGYRVISNCGKDAKQTVNHLHFHIIGGRELNVQIL